MTPTDTLLTSPEALLFLAALIAGFVDSIAGGGGLILLPAISLIVGAGPTAIGTNKLAALAMSLAALAVFTARGHTPWRKSAVFALAAAGGSLAGSRAALLIPQAVFPWLLAVTCPLLLYVVWQKDLWTPRDLQVQTDAERDGDPDGAFVRLKRNLGADAAAILGGLACGVYDGIWGPGAGTFMFLALLFFVRLPLLAALAASKVANALSAAVALGSYAASGHVRWSLAAIAAAAALAGGFLGARQATTRAARIVRPALVIVVLLLVVRVIAGESERAGVEFSGTQAYYVLRFAGALVLATLVPLLIDRRARRAR